MVRLPHMKHSRIHVRVDDVMKQRLKEAVAKLAVPGVDEASIVRGCLEAFVQEVETKGGIWLPITFRSADDSAKNENPAKRQELVAPPVVIPASASRSVATHSANEEPQSAERLPSKPISYRTTKKRTTKQ